MAALLKPIKMVAAVSLYASVCGAGGCGRRSGAAMSGSEAVRLNKELPKCAL